MDGELREAFGEVKDLIAAQRDELREDISNVRTEVRALYLEQKDLLTLCAEVRTRVNGHLEQHAVWRKWAIAVWAVMLGSIAGIVMQLVGVR